MSERSRDTGLDWIRVTGLGMMATAHYFERRPHDEPLAHLIWSIGDTGAAYFFFAFGMTAVGYFRRPRLEKIESILLLMYFVLAHNLYMWKLLVLGDFMLFLFASRLILLAIEESFARPTRVCALFFSGLLGLSLVLRDAEPLSIWSQETIGGFFTTVPWILFPLAGYLYRCWNPDRLYGVCLAIGSMAVASILEFYAEPLARPAWQIVKWPMTGPYLLFHGGAVILLYEGVNAARPFSANIPLLSRGIEALSQRLLTATGLHYIGIHLCFWLTPMIAWLNPAPGSDFEQVRTIVLGSAISVACLLATLWATERLWQRYRGARPLVALRERSASAALLILVSVAVLNNRPTRGWLTSIGVDPQIGKYVALVAMIYFAYEMAEWQTQRKARRTAAVHA